MKYPLTFIVKSLPHNTGAVANGPVIRILEKYKDDYGIYRHELLHVKQWFMSLGLHPFLYAFVPKYRLWAEVQCYKEQANHYPDDRKPLFAQYIAHNYKLDITVKEALRMLQE